MKPEPQGVLALLYWLHMLATVVWIGSMVSMAVWVSPSIRRRLGEDAQNALLDPLQTRLQQIGWFCLGILIVTGLFQMSSNAHYKGFLAIANSWAVAILLKHLLVGGMVGINATLTWGVTPALQRAALRAAHGIDVSATLGSLRLRQQRLNWVNLALVGAILALTALARVAA